MAAKFIDLKSAMEGPFGLKTLDLIIEVELDDGTHEDWPFHYVPSDGAPVTLAVKQYLADHPGLTIAKRVIPSRPVHTIHLTRRNVRLALASLGLPADAVELALAESEPADEREILRINWMEAQNLRRDDPIMVLTVNHWRSAGVDEAKLDAAWLKIASTPPLPPT